MPDAELAAIGPQRFDLLPRNRIGDRQAAIGRRHIVVGRGDGPLRPANLAAREPQSLESLRTGHFMDQVQIDVQNILAAPARNRPDGRPRFYRPWSAVSRRSAKCSAFRSALPGYRKSGKTIRIRRATRIWPLDKYTGKTGRVALGVGRGAFRQLFRRRRPKLVADDFVASADPAGFDASARRRSGCDGESARRGLGSACSGSKVFDHESRAAQAAQKFFPAVQEFERARLAMRTASTGGNGPLR